MKPNSIVSGDRLLAELRGHLKAQCFQPVPVRERMIPKANGKRRRLGIPTVRDRVVQASLKLVLEPIFEADFKPASYGFRPKRRAQDAIAEIHHFASHSYEWVLEGDITACFDEIDHTALMGRVRDRIGDKRVLALVKAFLKSGILSEDGVMVGTKTGTPQGGILSPLLANIALSVLDMHFAEVWKSWGSDSSRCRRHTKGLATYRIVRYADDFVVMVSGTRGHAEVMDGHVTDRTRAKQLEHEADPILGEARPDLLGSVTAYFDDDEFVEVAYFTSEEAARQGEARVMPPEMADRFAEWERVLKVDHYRDITDPWLTSA